MKPHCLDLHYSRTPCISIQTLLHIYLFSLMNHCQRVSTKSKNSDSSLNSIRKKAANGRGANSIPFCKKHQAHHHAMTTSTNVSSDNNGVKICCTNEVCKQTADECFEYTCHFAGFLNCRRQTAIGN